MENQDPKIRSSGPSPPSPSPIEPTVSSYGTLIPLSATPPTTPEELTPAPMASADDIHLTRALHEHASQSPGLCNTLTMSENALAAASITPISSATPATSVSSALVPYNPNMYQNRSMKPLPMGWTTSSKSLKSFSIFSKLPPDLRFMIWDFIMPKERSIRVWQHRSAAQSEDHDYIISSLPNSQPPITLSICHESRDLTLKTYRMFFDFSVAKVSETNEQKNQEFVAFYGDEMRPSDRSYIWLNPAVDFVSILPNKKTINFLSHASPKDLMEVRRLELSCTEFHETNLYKKHGWATIVSSSQWHFWNGSEDWPGDDVSATKIFEVFSGLKELRLTLDWWLGVDKDRVKAAQVLGTMLLKKYGDKHPEWSVPTFKFSVTKPEIFRWGF